MSPATAGVLLFRFGAFELDPKRGELRKGGLQIKLPPQPFQVLQLLAENAGELQSREHIHRRIWGAGTFVDFDRNLNVCMAQIRAALNDDAEAPRFIQTVPRRGYRFVAPVEKVTAPAAPSAVQERPVRPVRYLPIAVCAVACCLLALAYWMRREASRSAAPQRLMLAALPFENLGADAKEDLFIDALTEELIGQLGSLPVSRLGVIARSSVMRYRGSRYGIDRIGRELAVQYVVEGTVRREAGRLRVTARLIKAADQAQVWTSSYEQPQDSRLEMELDVAARITASIAAQLFPNTRSRASRSRTDNPEAWEAYRNGRYLQNKGERAGVERSISYFAQAAKLDPSFAPAYTSMAEMWIALGRSGSPRDATFPKADESARKAIALDDSSAEAHNALANVLFWSDWRWSEAERHFKRALEINPSLAIAHHDYGFFLVAMARTEEALGSLRRAVALDPLSTRVNIDAGWLLLQAHRFDEAIKQARRSLELEPGLLEAHACLSRAFLIEKNYSAARAELLRILQPSQLKTQIQGLPAEAAIEQYLQSRVNGAERNPFIRAMDYAFLNQKQNATDALERAYAERNIQMPLLQSEPAFNSLHGDARFQQLVRKLQLY